MVPTTSAPIMARPLTGPERVRRVLALLADRNGSTIKVTGYELAALAYFSRESTSREVARLCRAGVLARDGYGKLTVLKRDELEV